MLQANRPAAESFDAIDPVLPLTKATDERLKRFSQYKESHETPFLQAPFSGPNQ
nr:hypothetical protein [Rubripirellula sp.]